MPYFDTEGSTLFKISLFWLVSRPSSINLLTYDLPNKTAERKASNFETLQKYKTLIKSSKYLKILPATGGIKFAPQQHHMTQGVHRSEVHGDPRVLLRRGGAPARHEEAVHGARRGEVGGELRGGHGQAVQRQVLLAPTNPNQPTNPTPATLLRVRGF